MPSDLEGELELEKEIEFCMQQLKTAVLQAALPAEKQIERFKQFDASYCVASDFGSWCAWAMNSAQGATLSDLQVAALTALDEYLSEMSGPHNAKLWTDEALLKNPRWQRVRELAMGVMRQFDWTPERLHP